MNGIATDIDIDLAIIADQTRTVLRELLEKADLEPGTIVVVGCSSSEVVSHTIGTFSSEVVGKTIFDALHTQLKARGLFLAAQCCEHLNRALIIEKEYADAHNLEIVNVRPQLKAGGSFATAAFLGFDKPCAVEFIKADAGIDIGDTLIGMHLKSVAVPVRTKISSIGNAHVVCARTRAKYIGGERAAYV